jgi:hypothetical protein
MIDFGGIEYGIEVASAVGLLIAVCVWLAEKRDRNR